jgi:hypothetical protein
MVTGEREAVRGRRNTASVPQSAEPRITSSAEYLFKREPLRNMDATIDPLKLRIVTFFRRKNLVAAVAFERTSMACG